MFIRFIDILNWDLDWWHLEFTVPWVECLAHWAASGCNEWATLLNATFINIVSEILLAEVECPSVFRKIAKSAIRQFTDEIFYFTYTRGFNLFKIFEKICINMFILAIIKYMNNFHSTSCTGMNKWLSGKQIIVAFTLCLVGGCRCK